MTHMTRLFGSVPFRSERHGLAHRALVATMLCVSVSACMVGPDYVRPSLDVGAEYKEAPGWKIAQPSADVPRGPWWHMFGDSTLNELIRELNVNNQNIVQAEAQYRQAVAIANASRAPLYPSVGASGSMTRSGAGGTGSGGRSISTGPINSYNAVAQANWEIDLWGSIRRGIEAGDASQLASAANVAGVTLSSQGTLAQSYFQLRILDEQRRLLRATVQAYERSLQLTQNRYEAGVSGKGDVALARTQLENARAQMIDLEWQRAQLENIIAVLLGRAPSSFRIADRTFDLEPPPIPVGLPSELLQRRPDIANAERLAAAANAQIGVATAAWFPSLNITANGGYATTQFTQWFTAPAQFWALGPQLAQLIFDGGLRQAQIAQARAVFDAASAKYRQTVLQSLQEVETAMTQVRVFEEEQKVIRVAVESAKEALRLARNQYEQGLVDYLSVAVLETTALNTERNEISMMGNRLASSVRLIVAMGGGWTTEDLNRLNVNGQSENPGMPSTRSQTPADQSSTIQVSVTQAPVAPIPLTQQPTNAGDAMRAQ